MRPNCSSPAINVCRLGQNSFHIASKFASYRISATNDASKFASYRISATNESQTSTYPLKTILFLTPPKREVDPSLNLPVSWPSILQLVIFWRKENFSLAAEGDTFFSPYEKLPLKNVGGNSPLDPPPLWKIISCVHL